MNTQKLLPVESLKIFFLSGCTWLIYTGNLCMIPWRRIMTAGPVEFGMRVIAGRTTWTHPSCKVLKKVKNS